MEKCLRVILLSGILSAQISCGAKNANSGESVVADPVAEFSSSVSDEQKNSLGMSSKNTCKKTCNGVEYSLGGCWKSGGKTFPLHCKSGGKKIEQWMGDCDNKQSTSCLAWQYWKVK
ncbi:MAG: hypothetical protein RIR26_1676 [Pseudomonadota bacterium]|jgi:hypothetical protein